MVDLHGLHVDEALEYAKLEFQSVVPKSDKVVRFIVGTFPLKHSLVHATLYWFFFMMATVGKGKHTKGGKAKIRPAVEKLCEK